MLGRILGPLLEEFAAGKQIDATAEEVREFVDKMDAVDRDSEASYERELVKLRAALADARNDYQKKVIGESIQSLQESHASIEKLKPQLEKYRPSAAERREPVRATIRGYKINQALWAQYGGRVIFQQLGPEPLDAYRKFLEDHEKKGTFVIVDKTLVDAFWHYMRTDSMHMFLEDPQARTMMTTRWWAGPVPEE